LSLFVFQVFSGFSVITYHAKLILAKANVSETMDLNVGIIVIGILKVG
jgi:hypothetical protein